MRRAASNAVYVLAIGLVILFSRSIAWCEESPSAPLDLRLQEKVASQLVQLDVTLHGPPDALRDLKASDFTLVLGGRTVSEPFVDGTCAPTSAGGPSASSAPAVDQIPGKASYLFYFDHSHLTVGGRVRSLEVARDLVPRILASGARIRIVSSASALKTFAPWTDDAQVLLDGLSRLEADLVQFDAASDREARDLETFRREARSTAAMAGMSTGGVAARPGDTPNGRPPSVSPAIAAKVRWIMSAVKHLQIEEVQRAQAGLQRLTATLASLTTAAPPKALVYFADTMRINAGEHYLRDFLEIRASARSSLRTSPG